MDEERYDIVFHGEILPDHDMGHVMIRLAKLFKTDERNIKPLFDGDSWLIRRDVNTELAAKYKQALTNAGAVCILAPLFSNTTIESPHLPMEESEKKFKSETIREQIRSMDTVFFYSFKHHLLTPYIFSYRYKVPLQARDGSSILYTRPSKIIIGRLLALFLASIGALLNQFYLTKIIFYSLSTGTANTVLSILIYLGSFYLIYSILTFHKSIQIAEDEAFNQKVMTITSKSILKTHQAKYDIHDSKGQLIGWIRKNIIDKKLEVFDTCNKLLITADIPLEVDEIAASVLTETWKRLFYLKFIDYFRMIYVFFTTMDKYKVDEDHDLILQEGALKEKYVVRDTKGDVVAYCNIGNICNFKISNNPDVIVDKKIIIAVCLVISGI